MSVFNRQQQRQGKIPAARVFCPDSLDRSFLEVAAPDRDGTSGHRVPVLGRRSELPPYLRGQVLANEAAAEAVPAEAADKIDAGAVARWITAQYPDDKYAAVVLGSPHGGAAHLAATLGAAWLPTGFPVTLRWPGGSTGDWPAAMDWGAGLASLIAAGNPGVSVRQVHDPVRRGPLCGTTVTLRLRWRVLPFAYAEFLRTRLQPGGTSLLLRDMRTWPVLEAGPDFGFQVGSPTTGWTADDYGPDRPAFRRLLDGLGADQWSGSFRDAPSQYAETAGDPALDPQLRDLAEQTGCRTYRVLYKSPEMFSAGLADAFRAYLDGGEGCLVECGRLLDPSGSLRRRLIPYWCESASERAFTGAEWWLAGSEPFDDMTVLPEPPGTDGGVHATLRQWRSLASFAARNGRLDRVVAGHYPLLPLPTRQAARAVAEAAETRPTPPRLTMPTLIDSLRSDAAALGLLVG
ncbi:hypothetical protein [Paractinoplanes rishiriensis]|uniref:Uncharacterized protein n=1 Tax=Paractinoplanes rishiriensis TaxID=1050105 RepID=A0A919K8B4_9ACTN|nr:hypothetical protein [Actinoplanes rishiriensis]GIF00603.1 hypothetical protein Ari01nite_80670 [Actinoplanes rishiriensis]